LLEKVGFLEGLPPEYLEPLARTGKVADVPANEVLFEEGQKSANLYLMLEGKVALEIWLTGQGTKVIQTVGPGRLLGWTPVLAQGAMTATARAVEPSRVIALNALQVLEACNKNPSFGMEFMRRTALALSRRLHATRMQLLQVCEDAMPVMSE
jgi:CRP-like cAMP-binding protein